jgi:asparagine N-glycosylation enzyme membrane subunit Stt3
MIMIGILTVRHKTEKKRRGTIRKMIAAIVLVALYEIADISSYSQFSPVFGPINAVIQLFGIFAFSVALFWFYQDVRGKNRWAVSIAFLISGVIVMTGTLEILGMYSTFIFLLHNGSILIFALAGILFITKYMIKPLQTADNMPFYTEMPNLNKKYREKR